MKNLIVFLTVLLSTSASFANDMDVAYKVALAYVAGCSDVTSTEVQAVNKLPEYAEYSHGYEDEQAYVFNMSYNNKPYHVEVGIKNLDVRSTGCEQ